MENNEHFRLGLMSLSAERRSRAEDLYTIIQAGLLGQHREYDGAALLGAIIPPGRSPMYDGGYCPPYDNEIIAVLENVFEFSVVPPSGSDYMSVKVSRKSDGRNAVFVLKMPVNFGSSEYEQDMVICRRNLLNKMKRKSNKQND